MMHGIIYNEMEADYVLIFVAEKLNINSELNHFMFYMEVEMNQKTMVYANWYKMTNDKYFIMMV